jgi:homoserine kinase
LGLPATGLAVEAASDIPYARGLGSSAATIAAGIGAAYLLHGRTLDRPAIFRMTARMEGHPDNAAPAVLGGLRAAMQEEGNLYEVELALSDSLQWTALIPDFELPTTKARGVLPASLPRADAVYNLSHAMLLMKALETGDLPAPPSAPDFGWRSRLASSAVIRCCCVPQRRRSDPDVYSPGITVSSCYQRALARQMASPSAAA